MNSPLRQTFSHSFCVMVPPVFRRQEAGGRQCGCRSCLLPPAACLQKLPQLHLELGECFGPVADSIFIFCGQFAESPVQRRIEKKWVVAKSALSALLVNDK